MFKNILVKYFVVPFLNFFRFLFLFLRAVANYLSFRINTLIIYFEGGECEKFKDCVLLAKLLKNQPPNSDRYLEYPWVIKNIDLKRGRFLDVGSTMSVMFRDLLPAEVEVQAIDLNDKIIMDPRIKFNVGDIRKTSFPENFFDCISCVSTLEHIGVPGRYHSDDDPQGDLKTMQEMKRILKVGGSLLITVPYGRKDVLPINKLYNNERLGILLEGYEILEKKFMKFNKEWGFWFEVDEVEAAQTEMLKDQWYAICFIKLAKKV